MKRILLVIFMLTITSQSVFAQFAVVDLPQIAANAVNFVQQVNQWVTEARQWHDSFNNARNQLETAQRTIESLATGEWDGTLRGLQDRQRELSNLRSDLNNLMSRDDREYIQTLIRRGDVDALQAQNHLNETLSMSNEMLAGSEASMARVEQSLRQMETTSGSASGAEDSLQASLQHLNMQMSHIGTILAELVVATHNANQHARILSEQVLAEQAMANQIANQVVAPPPQRPPVNERDMERLILGDSFR
jgi:chromosome segregation ATPase